MLSVNVVPVAEVAGLNAAVAPVGKPDAAKLTEPVKPFVAVTLRASLPLLPCTTLKAGTAAVRLNPGGAVTVNVTLVVTVREPELPVMLIG